MHNKVINLALVAQVAQGLQELKDKMVFIGGAVISLYTDDPAAEEILPTADIDMTINLANYAEWAQMQERLSELGFYPDPQGQSICSYKYQDIAIDIMPADDSSIGVSNIWYKPVSDMTVLRSFTIRNGDSFLPSLWDGESLKKISLKITFLLLII